MYIGIVLYIISSWDKRHYIAGLNLGFLLGGGGGGGGWGVGSKGGGGNLYPAWSVILTSDVLNREVPP